MFKCFIAWILLKERLHSIEKDPPYVNERDIWWISFGDNIGSEINGKSELFSRPGLILKKLSKNTFLVAPTTTKIREGSWYVQIFQEGREVCICLHQIRVIDYRRLSNRLGIVDEADYKKIKDAFWHLYK